MNQQLFTNLPSHITISILSRLPVRTIINCKCVCKAWLNLIDTQEFVESHLSISTPGLAVYQQQMRSNSYRIYEFEDVLGLQHHELHYNPVTEFDLPYVGLLQGSANGLLFLRDLSLMPGGLFICNPITREYIELQCPQNFVYSYPQVVTYGFGASRVTGQHKVVRIFHDCNRDEKHKLMSIPKSECHVYTLGTGSWKEIKPSAPLEYSCRTTGAFLNGKLHWLVYDLNGSPAVSCFDLDTELFSVISLPTLLRHDRSLLGIFALGDSLCLSNNSSDDEIVIWLMKEYGVEKSWTKEFVISKLPDYAGESYEVVRPIKVFKDGDIVMQLEDFLLFFYSNKTKTIRKIETSEFPSDVDSIPHTSSFVPLKSFVMEIVRSF